MNDKSMDLIKKIIVVVGILVFSLFFISSPGTGNMDTWVKWINNGFENGVIRGFAVNSADYPPLASVILVCAGIVSKFLGIWIYTGIKITLLLFLCLTAIVFWAWTKDFFLTVVLYLSLVYNSIILGHLDVFFAPFLILSLWAFKERRIGLGVVSFCLASCIKWQPLIIAPFLLLYLLEIDSLKKWRQIRLKELVKKALLPFAAFAAVLLIIFGFEPMVNSFRYAVGQGYLSANALNLNWVITYFLHVFQSQQFGPLADGQITAIRNTPGQVESITHLIFFAIYLVVFIVFFKQEKTFKNLILFALMGYWAYFIFNPSVHENHLFITVLLVCILFWLDRKNISLLVTILLMSNLNLIAFNDLGGQDIGFPRLVNGVDTTLIIACFNICAFLIYFIINLLPERKSMAAQAPKISDKG